MGVPHRKEVNAPDSGENEDDKDGYNKCLENATAAGPMEMDVSVD